MVDGAAFAAVFLKDIVDGERILFCLPFLNQFLRAISGAVIHDEPFEVMEGLPLEGAVQGFQCVRPVIGRGKYGDFICKFHSVPQVSR